MNLGRTISAARWAGAAGVLAVVTVVYDRLLHVNATTVALTYLLFILFLSTRWGLRFAFAASLAATACYNFFFLPPVHTFTVSDPENLVALLVFLITSVVSSRMAERVRAESREAQARRAELEVLYGLSRALMETEELTAVTNTVPAVVRRACGARSVLLYLLEGDRTYRDGADRMQGAASGQMGPPELRALAQAPSASVRVEGVAGTGEAVVPLRTGVRPRGVLLLEGVQLSLATLEAMGGLVSVALDRAQAVDVATRAEAGRESERLRTVMMDSITHEFRSPLTAIKVSVSALRMREPGDAGESTELLAIIEEEADRLDRLVAQAVEMARLDTLDVTMSFTAQSVADLVDAARETAAAALASHPVNLMLPPALLVEADPEWMTRLLVNLLENAGKYSPAGAPIFVTAERQRDTVAVSVADRGVGIDPLEQELIFDKFYRSRERAGNVPGTGMGLSICRAIAHAHGGTLQVTSQPGQGSVFTTTLRAAS